MKRALILAVGLSLCACSSGAPNARATGVPSGPNPGAPTTVPVRVIEPHVPSRYIYITEQKKNRTVYKMRADSATGVHVSEGSGRTDFVNPHVTFYQENGKQLVADAPHATALESDRSVLMTGGAHARNTEGMTLQSDTLRYDDRAEMLYGDGNVLITTAQHEQLSGRRFDYNLRTTEIHVTGQGR